MDSTRHPGQNADDNDIAESFFDAGGGGLPVIFGGLPMTLGCLPVIFGNLPVIFGGLPVIFGGRRRNSGGSLQHLVDSDGRRSFLDTCCWYGPITVRCFAACVRSRPFLFFIYVVLALVVLSSCVCLVLVGSLVARPYIRVSGFVNTTCSPSVVSEGSRNGQVVMQTCTCGKGCNSKYRCIRIHVRYTPESGAETSAVLYDDETALGRQVVIVYSCVRVFLILSPLISYSMGSPDPEPPSVIFVNENENENGEKRENNEFVNEN